MFYVYALENEKSGKIYIGQTCNFLKRLQRHNNLLKTKKTSYTYKNKGNWKLIYKEKYLTRIEAIIREKQLKSFRGREFIKSICSRSSAG